MFWSLIILTLISIVVWYGFGPYDNTVYTTLFVLIVGVLFYWQYKRNGSQKETSDLPPVSKEKESFYLEQGLTKSEMNYFRETMNEARIQIIELEKAFETSPRLKTINHRYQTVETAQNFFRAIVEHPLQLSQVDDFLYRHLPDLVSLSHKFLEIEQHPNKNKATLQVIEKSSEKIEHLCQQIEEDYLTFQQNELDSIHTNTVDTTSSDETDRKDEIDE